MTKALRGLIVAVLLSATLCVSEGAAQCIGESACTEKPQLVEAVILDRDVAAPREMMEAEEVNSTNRAECGGCIFFSSANAPSIVSKKAVQQLIAAAERQMEAKAARSSPLRSSGNETNETSVRSESREAQRDPRARLEVIGTLISTLKQAIVDRRQSVAAAERRNRVALKVLNATMTYLRHNAMAVMERISRLEEGNVNGTAGEDVPDGQELKQMFAESNKQVDKTIRGELNQRLKVLKQEMVNATESTQRLADLMQEQSRQAQAVAEAAKISEMALKDTNKVLGAVQTEAQQIQDQLNSTREAIVATREKIVEIKQEDASNATASVELVSAKSELKQEKKLRDGEKKLLVSEDARLDVLQREKSDEERNLTASKATTSILLDQVATEKIALDQWVTKVQDTKKKLDELLPSKMQAVLNVAEDRLQSGSDNQTVVDKAEQREANAAVAQGKAKKELKSIRRETADIQRQLDAARQNVVQAKHEGLTMGIVAAEARVAELETQLAADKVLRSLDKAKVQSLKETIAESRAKADLAQDTPSSSSSSVSAAREEPAASSSTYVPNLNSSKIEQKIDESQEKLNKVSSKVQRARDELQALSQRQKDLRSASSDDVSSEQVRLATEAADIKAAEVTSLAKQEESSKMNVAAAAFQKEAEQLQERNAPLQQVQNRAIEAKKARVIADEMQVEALEGRTQAGEKRAQREHEKLAVAATSNRSDEQTQAMRVEKVDKELSVLKSAVQAAQRKLEVDKIRQELAEEKTDGADSKRVQQDDIKLETAKLRALLAQKELTTDKAELAEARVTLAMQRDNDTQAMAAATKLDELADKMEQVEAKINSTESRLEDKTRAARGGGVEGAVKADERKVSLLSQELAESTRKEQAAIAELQRQASEVQLARDQGNATEALETSFNATQDVVQVRQQDLFQKIVNVQKAVKQLNRDKKQQEQGSDESIRDLMTKLIQVSSRLHTHLF